MVPFSMIFLGEFSIAIYKEWLMPVDYVTRKYELFSRYCFGSGHHTLRFEWLNPHPDYVINAQTMLIYDNE